ncbi:MAG: hypothetical protein PHV68_08445 [Candidatus Gastranaerophilales bacterium]|nr:hypothetical protein [Candidatus Gastranaerophilales bacterium]
MIKSLIKTLFYNTVKTAVVLAEQKFGNGNGQDKKLYALNFVLSKLPIPAFIYVPLKDFILEIFDELIEKAVQWLKTKL